jgi:hypothetical protein
MCRTSGASPAMACVRDPSCARVFGDVRQRAQFFQTQGACRVQCRPTRHLHPRWRASSGAPRSGPSRSWPWSSWRWSRTPSGGDADTRRATSRPTRWPGARRGTPPPAAPPSRARSRACASPIGVAGPTACVARRRAAVEGVASAATLCPHRVAPYRMRGGDRVRARPGRNRSAPRWRPRAGFLPLLTPGPSPQDRARRE